MRNSVNKDINFTKMVGAGNDFIVIDCLAKKGGKRYSSFSNLAGYLCERRVGVGADGMLVLEKSRTSNFKMRIFNADGSEAEMCGNGLRCAVLFFNKKGNVTIETMAGRYEARITGRNKVKIKMERPKDITLDIPVKLNGRRIHVSYIDTGVPHAVVFVNGLNDINVESIGRSIRFYNKFKPRGTNVDFVEIMDDKNIKMRTYERGVEGETLACGTGAVASALITSCKLSGKDFIKVHTKGGILNIFFSNKSGNIKDVFLEGEAKTVFKGKLQGGYYV